ncbi:MAG: hypothetical protein GTO18_12155 [Anaerolineales bacterium]|nr:hypothetical protein [Anaerolineales bacterium]
MTNDIQMATSNAIESAIEFCAEKAMLNDRQSVLAARERADCIACDYLRYGVAKGIADYFGKMDTHTRAIYFYNDGESTLMWDKSSPKSAKLTPGIRLILWASKKSPALMALVNAVIESVENELRELYCPNANALCNQLDVIVVDDQEVEGKTGYGALIESLYFRPIEIWHR